MVKCVLEPVSAAVVGCRKYDGIRIPVGNISFAVVELLEIHLDIPIDAVVIVASDPSYRRVIIVSYER